MRILHIVGGMDQAGGGPQEVVRLLLRFSPAGTTNEIATLDPPDAAFLRSSDLPIHPLGSASGAWYSPRLIPWLRAHRNQFDGVIQHGLWNFTSIATRVAITGKQPYLVFPHGMLDPYFRRAFPLKHVKKLPFWFANERALLRRAERVLFTTDAERDLAKESFPLWQWHALVVGLGTEPAVFDRVAAKQAFLHACPGVTDRRYLLFLGRIHPKKGCDLLLQAFAHAARADPALHLVMAGPDSGDWQPELEAMAAHAGAPLGRIHWPGMLQGDAKWGAFAACDAFVLPSHQENFGIAIVEALACGRPVLLTEPINIAADLQAAGCAFVAPDTLHGIRNLLASWNHCSPDERERMGALAFKTFTARYDMRRNTAAVFAAFHAGA